ncbi:ABC transporter substrate-binding protein [Paracoccus aminophilus]|uniref:ABC-type dipeptide transport system, extracellular solute-binding protein n=1 Tax=Paracoccus aminophilus JCM 7686 TaxID=1367847 RepID=S5YGW7_PARAH|nr:ABC transporter substrate-binding protein [Paracoccus aminophilus]AGT10713.1 ABC-type dipeptide transport system, extracellular solute-binding protein [Paracoccus aminophilus JCM 7686]
MTRRSPAPFTLSRRLLLGSAAAAVLTRGFGGAALAETADPAPVSGGTVTFNVGSEPPTLISATNTGAAMHITAKVVEGLLSYDTDFNPQPQLATDWEVSPDGLTYTFKLREGVSWHDGKPFTAEDVAFSILALKEEHPRARGTFANITEVEILDPHQIRIRLSHPAPYLLKALAAMEAPILPKHIFGGEKLASNPALSAPIGTGPFRFKEWVRGSHVLLTRNPDYWEAGKPYLDQIVLRFITDQGAAAAALETGEVQVSMAAISVRDIDRLQTNPALGFDSRATRYNNSILRALFNLDRPELKDVRVRHAIAHAFDKDFIVDTVYLGHAKRLDGPISPGVTAFYTPDLKRYAYDPAQAEALLDAAGFPRGADGVRFTLTIDPMDATGPHRQIADYLAQALNAVGIRSSVRTQDFAGFVKRVYTDRDFDLAIEPMSNLFDPTVGVQRLYWSKNFKPGVPFSNGAHYANPEVDRLLEAAASENDPAKRKELFTAFQNIVVEDLPAIDLVAPDAYVFWQKPVRHLTDVTLDGVSNNWANVFLAS